MCISEDTVSATDASRPDFFLSIDSGFAQMKPEMKLGLEWN